MHRRRRQPRGRQRPVPPTPTARSRARTVALLGALGLGLLPSTLRAQPVPPSASATGEPRPPIASAAVPAPEPPAQPGPGAAPADRRRTAALEFQAAHRAFEDGDYEQARAHYEKANALAPHPNILYNLALTCERQLDYDGAIAAFERFLAALEGNAEHAASQNTRRLLAERSLRRLRGLPARISASAVPDTVNVEIAPLLPDGQLGPLLGRGVTPHILTVPAGRYRLTYSRDGYIPEHVDFDAHVGQALLLSRHLAPQPRTLRIESVPRARLYLDDRLLGETPFEGPVDPGSHRLRLERRFFLTQLRPLVLSPGAQQLRYRIALQPSGRLEMLVGGALAGAGLGLMVLRIFQGEIENLENMPAREIYKPLVAALLPAALGATVAGLAGWEMPVNQAQLLIGTAGWGALVGFGVGLGSLPEGVLPHVLAIGGALLGGTVGSAVWRFRRPGSGPVALFNSTVLWSAQIGALYWAYRVTRRPDLLFFGRPSEGRGGEGGWAMLSSTLIGVGAGIAMANLPWFRGVTRSRMARIDLGGLLGGAGAGLVGLGIGYAVTDSFEASAQVAIPCAIGGLGVGLISAALLTRNEPSESSPTSSSGTLLGLRRRSQPTPYIGPDGLGGFAFGALLFDGEF